MSKYVVYASDFAKLDSNVIHGGGTDETEILQNILDKAPEWGHLHLVMDGAALVRGLQVHSNTTIECLDKSCGFFLADNSDCAILRNSNRGYDSIRTAHVTLLGGTYNHNCLHQAHDVYSDDPAEMAINMPERYKGEENRHATVALEFIGIEYLTVKNLTVRDQRTYAFTVGNFRHVHIENTYIELENEILFGNQDGFHFWGPGQFLTMRNIGGKTQDDFMNIGPDERDGVSSITDVLVDGVMLDGAYQGIRLLSRGTGLLDRVTIRNVTGTYRCFGFYINPWFIDKTMGNFGNIVFENIDLRPGPNPYENTAYSNPPFLFSIGGDIESITFRNVHWYHPCDDRTVFQIGYPFHDVTYPFEERKPRIGFLLIDGFYAMQKGAQARNAVYFDVRGIVERLNLRNIHLLCDGAEDLSGCLLKTLPDAEIRRLTLEDVTAEKTDILLDLEDGETELLILRDVLADRVRTALKGGAKKQVGSITELES